jgi:hypothetical protein
VYPISEKEFESELHLPRRIGLRGDHPERTRIDAGVRSAKYQSVRQIERLGSKLQGYPFRDSKVLEEGEVQIPAPSMTKLFNRALRNI